MRLVKSIIMVVWTVSLLLAGHSALAQQSSIQSASPNPSEQIARTIGNLAIENANLAAQLQGAKAQIEDLQKKLSEAEAKASKSQPSK